MKTPASSRRLLMLLAVSFAAILLVLILAETALRIVKQPRFPDSHEESKRFMLTDQITNGLPVYVNYPGIITFTYADNPRGYFDSENKLHHEVNPDGFRGRPFSEKQPGTQRIVFLGDSFTFGEGVRLKDTYPEITTKYLGANVEACNLGVGGYNTTQEEDILKSVGWGLQPDAVVIGYTPNDAEPPLFTVNTMTGQVTRRDREASVEAEGSPKRPPSTPLYKLHLAQLTWHKLHQRRLSKQTISHYQALYAADKADWKENQRALRAIISDCRTKNIPCIVVMFPILHKLSDYPLKDVHQKVGDVVRGAGGIFVDLLPALKNKDAEQLWVHPTDHHPNERVHAIAGEKVAAALREFTE